MLSRFPQPSGCATLCRVSAVPYRFGAGQFPSEPAGLREAIRRYEELGFDFVATGDHVGGPAPFALLTAAAAVSERLRLRTYVLNTSFWNPTLLARAAATLDRFSNGRLELGLGAGTIKTEFDTAGIPWRPPSERIELMKATLLKVRGLLDADDHSPQPVQTPVPTLIGAMSRGGLMVAAEHADIVGFAALRHSDGHPPGTLRAATAEEADEAVDTVRRAAGPRVFESDVLLQTVELGKDPLAGARAFLEREGEPDDPMTFAESPCALFARTAADAAEELERRRERWGFTSITTFAASSDALAAVARELR